MRRLVRRARLLPLAAAVLATWAAPAGSQGQASYRLVRTGERQVTLAQRIKLDGGGKQVSQYGFLVPVPSAVAGLQSDFKVEMQPVGGEAKLSVSEKKRDGLRLLEVTANVDPNGPLGKAFVMDVTYTGTVYGQALMRGSPDAPVPPLAADERQRCLASNAYFDFEGQAFRDAAQSAGLLRQPGEDEVAHGLRVARAIPSGFRYVKDTTEEDPASEISATAVLKRGGSDCAGLSVLYASVMRLSGTPTAHLPGWLVNKSVRHARTAFYAAGVGWVPVDVTTGVSGAPEQRWFGSSAADFVAFHQGAGINPPNSWEPNKQVTGMLRPLFMVAHGSGQGKPFAQIISAWFR